MQDVTDAQCARYRVLYGLLVATAVIVYLFAMSRPNLGSNACAYVAVPGLLSVIGLFLTAVAVFVYIFSKRKMTTWGYKATSVRLKKITLVTGLLLAATSVMALVYILLNPENNLAGDAF